MNAEQLLRALRWPIVFALVLITLGGLALYAANDAFVVAERTLNDAERTERQAASRLLAARTQEDEVRQAIDEYARLVDTGLVGPEQRLLWVETLDNERKRLGIDNIRYEILPQRPYTTESGDGINWMESRMRLTMELPHGQALLDLLGTLLTVPSAVVQTRQCQLERETTPDAPIRATCELAWLTLRIQSGSP